MNSLNIVIDQGIIDGYQHNLNQSIQLLQKIQSENNRLRRENERKTLLSVEQACAFLGGITPDTIHHHRTHNSLPYIKKGNTILFMQGDLEDWVATGKTRKTRLHA